MMPKDKRLILASKSPRRQELLTGLGLSFSVIPSDMDETITGITFPGHMVEQLALKKSRAVACKQSEDPNALVIGADTVVVLDGNVLGQPRDENDAATMLRQLSGRWHKVFTGVAVTEVLSCRSYCDFEVTSVKFKLLDQMEIDSYVRTGEPLDKAGGYGIQGKGALLVERIDGCFYNVVGLPLVKLVELLQRFDFDVLG